MFMAAVLTNKSNGMQAYAIAFTSAFLALCRKIIGKDSGNNGNHETCNYAGNDKRYFIEIPMSCR